MRAAPRGERGGSRTRGGARPCFVRTRWPACGGRRRSNSLRSSSGSSTARTVSALSFGGSLMLPEQDARRRSGPFDQTRGLTGWRGLSAPFVRGVPRSPPNGSATGTGPSLGWVTRARLFSMTKTVPGPTGSSTPMPQPLIEEGRRKVTTDARGSLILALLGHAAADGGPRQRFGCRDASRRPSQRASAAAPGRTRS